MILPILSGGNPFQLHLNANLRPGEACGETQGPDLSALLFPLGGQRAQLSSLTCPAPSPRVQS